MARSVALMFLIGLILLKFTKTHLLGLPIPKKIEDVGNKKNLFTKIPGSDKNFPKLASVPSRPVGLSRINRARISNSLVLDRKKSKEIESKIKSYLKTKEGLEEKTNFLNTKSLERGQKTTPYSFRKEKM